MVIKGPGTIWESWTDSTNSHNHPALSADIGVYLYSLAGVEPVDRWGLGGNRRIVFELDAATARAVGSAAVFVSGLTGGRASFCWRFEEGVAQTTGSEAFELNVTIPHGEDAELHLPINPDHRCHNFDVGIEDRLSTVWSSCTTADESVLQSVGLSPVRRERENLVAVAGSGSYRLRVHAE
eukprot:SAG25_NODE_558_length_6927_cov_5.344171_4_plen_181_part_00